MKHDWYPDYPRDKLAHSVSLKSWSFLHQLFGEDQIQVNSLHHQGIARVGDGLEAIGFAPDGLVEALVVEDTGFALWGCSGTRNVCLTILACRTCSKPSSQPAKCPPTDKRSRPLMMKKGHPD